MQITIDTMWLTLLTDTILPAIVALVTKQLASSNLKSLTLLALSVVAGFLTSLYAAGGTFSLKAAVTNIGITFITAVAAHYGLLKPTNITGSSGSIATRVSGGIGTVQVPESSNPTPTVVNVFNPGSGADGPAMGG